MLPSVAQTNTSVPTKQQVSNQHQPHSNVYQAQPTHQQQIQLPSIYATKQPPNNAHLIADNSDAHSVVSTTSTNVTNLSITMTKHHSEERLALEAAMARARRANAVVNNTTSNANGSSHNSSVTKKVYQTSSGHVGGDHAGGSSSKRGSASNIANGKRASWSTKVGSNSSLSKKSPAKIHVSLILIVFFRRGFYMEMLMICGGFV